MDSLSVPELVERLSSDEESVRKMAVFKLQGAIGDPSFADVFIQEGGLPKLRFLALHSTGNTLAYCLTSLSRLLELDKGWDHVTDDLIKRVGSPRKIWNHHEAKYTLIDRRAGCRTTFGQREQRRHVSPRGHRWPSFPSHLTARCYWFPAIKTSGGTATTVSPYARRKDHVRRSCLVRQFPPTHKFLDAGRYCK